MGILECLQRGKENAVSLEYIAIVTGMNAREVRNEISRITSTGEECICNAGRGKGYFLADSIEEAKSYLKYNSHYLKSFAEKDRGIKKYIENTYSGQINLPDCINP